MIRDIRGRGHAVSAHIACSLGRPASLGLAIGQWHSPVGIMKKLGVENRIGLSPLEGQIHERFTPV